MCTVILFVVLAASATAAATEAAPAPATVACTMETRGGQARELLYTTDYLVDARGLLVAEDVHNGKARIQRVVYGRDADSRVVRKCTFDLQGETEAPNGCAILRYKGRGRRPIGNQEIAADGTVAATTTFEYDARGREITRRLVRANGKTVTQTRTYGPGGRLDSIHVVDARFGSTLFRYEYAKTGELARVILESLDPDHHVLGAREYVKPCTPALLLDAS